MSSLRSTFFGLLLLAGSFGANAQDSGHGNRFAASQPMPTLTSGMYGTKAGDSYGGNLGQYLYRSSSPIKFSIFINDTDPTTRAATFQMAVYDVDADSTSYAPEIDTVTVNGVKVGVLNGTNDSWAYGVFNIPVGTLKAGENIVSVSIDDNNIGWAVQIDWGVISLTGGSTSSGTVQIPRGWVTPTEAKGGEWINIFAEVGGSNIAKVEAYYDLGVIGLYLLTTLTDPDGDKTYSGQFQLPAGLAAGRYNAFTVIATDKSGNKAYWPGVVVK